jgi:hypothetical protein
MKDKMKRIREEFGQDEQDEWDQKPEESWLLILSIL